MNRSSSEVTNEVFEFLVKDKDFKAEYDKSKASNEGVSYKDTLEYYLFNAVYIQHYFETRKDSAISWLELSTKDVVNLDSLIVDYRDYLETEY